MRLLSPRFILIAFATSFLATAGVITSNSVGEVENNFANFALGQSVTTPSGGPWQNITFNLVNGASSTQGGAGTPLASGTLFLLTQLYFGLPASLSTLTPGFVANTSTVSSGKWVFDPSVTLAPSTQYFFYMATLLPTGTVVRFSDVNPYAGGSFIRNAGDGTSFLAPFAPSDGAFSLEGTTTTPEPSTFLMLGTAVAAVLARRRGARGCFER